MIDEITNDRLREIIRDERSTERAQMARELLAHRERAERVATAAVEGNSRAVIREFSKDYRRESRVP